MPLAVSRLDNVPRPTRNKKRALESTEEWLQLKAKLADGLRPYEAIYITFTPQQREQLGMKTLGRSFKIMAASYIKQMGLQYDVWRYHSEGQEVVVVAARGAAGQPREEPLRATGTTGTPGRESGSGRLSAVSRAPRRKSR